ncbi:MAG: hypothetical protein HC861_04455 [Rhodospirillaceae bacterium]|nr:hypothetical protein [Rhodospirillaceae bacterium]
MTDRNHHPHPEDRARGAAEPGADDASSFSRTIDSSHASLPDEVSIRPLPCHRDDAAWTVDVYRRDWPLDIAPVQWNFVSSRPNVLRGVHVHVQHWDYLHVVSGAMLLGLHDMRPRSPTYRRATRLCLEGDRPVSIAIPPGVAHGFYFASATAYIYAMSHYWTPVGELGCRWDDPELGLAWPESEPVLSARDAAAPSYAELARALASASGEHIDAA